MIALQRVMARSLGLGRGLSRPGARRWFRSRPESNQGECMSPMPRCAPAWVVLFCTFAVTAVASPPTAGDGQAVQRPANEGNAARISDEFLVNVGEGRDDNHATIAVEDDGHFSVVWSVKQECQECVGLSYFRRFDRHLTPATGEVPVDSTLGGQNHPDIGTDGHSFYVLAWDCRRPTRAEPSEFDLCARKFDIEGRPLGEAFPIMPDSSRKQEFPDVDVNSSGDVVILWTEENPDTLGDYHAQRFDSDLRPVGDRIRVNTVQSKYVGAPDIVMNDAGQFVAVWHQRFRAGMGEGETPFVDADIFFRCFDADGSPLTDPIKADQDLLPHPSRPNAALMDNGTIVLSWRYRGHPVGLGRGVSARAFDWTGAPLTDEFLLPADAGDHSFPFVAGDNVGFLWTDHDASDAGIFGQMYSPKTREASTDVAMINQYQISQQLRPAAAAQTVGDSTYVVITWESRVPDQDDGSQGIYGRQVIFTK